VADFFRSLHETTAEYRDWDVSDHPRIRTGFPFFDGPTEGGVARGEVGILMARSSVGKTNVGLNIIRVNPSVPTVMFSLEMHGRYIVRRLAASHMNVSTSVVRHDHPALLRLEQDYPMLSIIDRPSMGLRDMDKALEEARKAWGRPAELIVIDYLELIGGVPAMSANEGVAKVARKIKDFARTKDAAVWVLHQVSRSAGDAGDEPLDITSGKYGGEEAADYLMGAYRPCLRKGISQQEYQRTAPELFLQFLKTRSGGGIHPQGVRHRLDPESLRLTEWDAGVMSPLFPEPLAPEIEEPDHDWFEGEIEGVLT
jgi:hypothetical protein